MYLKKNDNNLSNALCQNDRSHPLDKMTFVINNNKKKLHMGMGMRSAQHPIDSTYQFKTSDCIIFLEVYK